MPIEHKGDNPHIDRDLSEGNITSAREVFSVLLPLLEEKKINSVVDVGCGHCEWLQFIEQNYKKISFTGIDGPWVKDVHTKIDKSKIKITDLSDINAVSKCSLELRNQFDLAISLEVGEHLSEEAAEEYVNLLCDLAPVVLFSAALPGQGGFNHVNEQWPEYWREKFLNKGFDCLDILRDLIWENESIQPHYRQNIFLYYLPGTLSKIEIARGNDNNKPISRVHPKQWNLLRAIHASSQLRQTSLGILRSTIMRIPRRIIREFQKYAKK